MADPSLLRFRTVLAAGLAHLEANRSYINDLNVFPVADGDTGDNMALTLRAVLDEVDHLVQSGDLDEIGRNQIVDSVARAALLGARGNSGVILSQLIRGAAEELISRPGELVDPVLVGAAFARAADRAYDSVREPAEGTILTAVREMAHRVASQIAHMEIPRLTSGTSIETQDESIASILTEALVAGREATDRGPQLLTALRDAGVVDAGAFGICIILAGVTSALRGEPLPQVDNPVVAPRTVAEVDHESSTYRYCVNFVVSGSSLDPDEWRSCLEDYGDSLLAIGDNTTMRVHIHTDEPVVVTSLFAPNEVSRIDIADMEQQQRERRERLQSQKTALIPVVSAKELGVLYKSFGAIPLIAGRTMNPSTQDLLEAIESSGAEEVVLLPNSSNIFLAAERVVELTECKVEIVRSTSQQTGLAVAVGFSSGKSAAANAEAMRYVLNTVRCGYVTPAAKNDREGRFVVGDSIGFIEDRLTSWGSPEVALSSVLNELGSDAELLTVISGEDAPIAEDQLEALIPNGVEWEHSVGGQPTYWWLVSAER